MLERPSQDSTVIPRRPWTIPVRRAAIDCQGLFELVHADAKGIDSVGLEDFPGGYRVELPLARHIKQRRLRSLSSVAVSDVQRQTRKHCVDNTQSPPAGDGIQYGTVKCEVPVPAERQVTQNRQSVVERLIVTRDTLICRQVVDVDTRVPKFPVTFVTGE